MMPAKKCPCGEATYTLVKLTTTAAQIKCVACGIERVTKSADELEKIKAQRQVPQGYEQPGPATDSQERVRMNEFSQSVIDEMARRIMRSVEQRVMAGGYRSPRNAMSTADYPLRRPRCDIVQVNYGTRFSAEMLVGYVPLLTLI